MQQEQEIHTSEWKLLLIYNIYRLGCILLFYGITIYEDTILLWVYDTTYLLIAFLGFYFWHTRKPRFQIQILITGSLDVVFQSLLIILLEGSESWLGILLIFTIAALSILVPGRLAIFFASVATCILLSTSIWQFTVGNEVGLGNIFYAGVHGAGIFATAITALFLAKRVRLSENIAAHRSRELAMMQQINNYIVERLQSGVIYIDGQRRIQFMNDAVKEIFNLRRSNKIYGLTNLSNELDKACQVFLSSLNAKMHPAKSMLKTPYPLEIHFLPTRVSSEIMVLIFIDDLSVVSQQAQQLKLASLGRFSASIAHELRNPLGAIAHAAQLMGETSEVCEEDQRLKELILRNCSRMNGVIKNVLQLSRREQANQEKIDLIEFLANFQNEFAAYKSCQISVHLPESKKIPLHFDKSQLEQILIILCENSLEHGKNKNGETFITIKVHSQNNRVQIMVCDTGLGIKEDLQEMIFEPFFSTDRSGNGMGLFIARDLCEINQAKLSLKKTSKGACFMITTQQINEMQL